MISLHMSFTPKKSMNFYQKRNNNRTTNRKIDQILHIYKYILQYTPIYPMINLQVSFT